MRSPRSQRSRGGNRDAATGGARGLGPHRARRRDPCTSLLSRGSLGGLLAQLPRPRLGSVMSPDLDGRDGRPTASFTPWG